MGDRLRHMVYKTHPEGKIKTYNPKIRDYKIRVEPRKPEIYQLPDSRKNAFSKVSNYKISDYKAKDYKYKEYVPPWERGEIRKKKMRSVARFLPKKKEQPKQTPPPSKNEPKPKPKPKPEEKPKPEPEPKPKPKPKPVPPPRQEPKTVKPEPKPPITPWTEPVEEPENNSEITKNKLNETKPQTTPPRQVISEPKVPIKEYQETEMTHPPMKTETEALVHVNDRPSPNPNKPLFKPTYSPMPKSVTTYNRRLKSPQNTVDNLNF